MLLNLTCFQHVVQSYVQYMLRARPLILHIFSSISPASLHIKTCHFPTLFSSCVMNAGGVEGQRNIQCCCLELCIRYAMCTAPHIIHIFLYIDKKKLYRNGLGANQQRGNSFTIHLCPLLGGWFGMTFYTLYYIYFCAQYASTSFS